jgi:hypothetical protein
MILYTYNSTTTTRWLIADPEKFRENIRVKLNAVIQNESSPRTWKGILNYTINEATINKVIKEMEKLGVRNYLY